MNIKCKKCNRVLNTKAGFYAHWYKKHDGSATEMWKETTEEITQGHNKNQQKSNTKIITPEMSFIDISVILRIPIILGQAKILEIIQDDNN